VPTHYTRREPGVLDIYSKYSLKIPRIYSNILNISLLGGHGDLTGKWSGGGGGRAGEHTDNPAYGLGYDPTSIFP
jgi:hypothetical protein